MEFLTKYKWSLAGLLVFLLLLIHFPYGMLCSMAVGVAVCFIIGVKTPEFFRPLFGAKANKSFVNWTFGGLFFLIVMVSSGFEPKDDSGGLPDLAPTGRSAKEVKQAPKTSGSRTGLGTSSKENPVLRNDPNKSPDEKVDPDAPKVDLLGTHPIKASVLSKDGILHVNSLDFYDYRDVKVIINSTGIFGGYFYEAPILKAGEQLQIPITEFATKRGAKRFDPVSIKMRDITVRCKTKYGMGIGFFTFS